jgi:hypothetical protein
VDSRGHVLVLHRGAQPILEFDGAEVYPGLGDRLFSEGR